VLVGAVPAIEIDVAGKVALPQNHAPLVIARQETNVLVTAAFVIIPFSTELIDTDNAFSGGTFNPKVPGAYQVNATAVINNSTNDSALSIYKNGARFCDLGGGKGSGWLSGAAIVQMNGTTDTLDIRAYCAIDATLLGNAFSNSLSIALAKGV
jgi:hypothetical protein